MIAFILLLHKLDSSCLTSKDTRGTRSEEADKKSVEETGCLQAKVYLQKELFVKYEYTADAQPRFGVSLGLWFDCLNMFSVPGYSSMIELRYPGLVMELLLKTKLILAAGIPHVTQC
ncbi:hypothetical protein RND81_01G192100 [Saponaria officinalis]|uniref:Uncharacterized protein n=1 Tax=Saponaria officinalis TaxID=3572 RepID=A0AAW1NID1_SAPOF